MYTNKYNDNIKSYKGFGVVTPRFTKDLKYKNQITKLTDKNLTYNPPLYETSSDNDPQDTNGYLNSKNYIVVPKTIDNYYYTSQQMDKVDNKCNYNKKNPFKFPPPLVTTEVKKSNIDSESESKSKLKKNKSELQPVISDKLINKAWYDGRYLYSFEPRYNDVIKPNRIYTWTYPFMPNTDNYYRDDIQQRGNSPIIFDNIDSVEPLPDYDATSSNIENVENFEVSNGIDYNLVYVVLFSIALIVIIKK